MLSDDLYFFGFQDNSCLYPRWSEVARRAMELYARKLSLLDKLLKNSELTEADAMEIGRKIKHGVAKRHGL
jgi:hypothetical protein